MTYEEFIARKSALPMTQGITEHGPLASHLFPHQRDLVSWALRRGRAAVFADTGLGKTTMALEWARHVVEHAGGPVLVLTPLAVADQWVREGVRWGVPCVYARSHEQAGDASIVITNYEMLGAFDVSRFKGVVIDESSILKSYNGATRIAIIEAFAHTPFKLACTATPAPNDHTELGNHSEFLGVKSRVEMLAEYFVHDGGSTQDWRLKGHAVESFWRWVCSWAAVVRMPSDLGHDDAGYALPELRMHEHVIEVGHDAAHRAGQLFAIEARTLSEQRATRRATLDERVRVAAELAAGDEPALIWCELNAEGDALERAIAGAVQVKGSDDREVKRARLLGFADGVHRVMVSKPKLAGFGMNWQQCAKIIFVGASHSYEQTYQAIRRCWRFGQTRPVDVHVIRAETEGAIVANFNKKAAAHAEMMEGMLAHMRDIQKAEIHGAAREWNDYAPSSRFALPPGLRAAS